MNAVPRLSPGLSHPTDEAAYARFGERFARRILTDRELERYHERRARSDARGVAYLATRFAAKEAGREAEAMAQFQAVIEGYPDSPLWGDAWMMIGEHHFAVGAWAEARAAYENILGDPDSATYDLAMFKSAWCDWKLGDPDRAAQRFIANLVVAFIPAALLGLASSADAAVPGPCPGRAIQPDRVITGEFGTELAKSFVMVPFDAPRGTTAIRVKYCFDRPETGTSRHTLDLGLYEPRRGRSELWGPREFRGWGGSSHPDVTVSAEGFSTEAEYTASPRIDPPGKTTRQRSDVYLVKAGKLRLTRRAGDSYIHTSHCRCDT